MAITVGDDAHVAIMRKAGQILLYYKEHEEHPQAESLTYPNRVAIDEGYYASICKNMQVPLIAIFPGDNPGFVPCVEISRQTITISNSATPALTVEDADFLVTKFQTLLNMSFFKG